MLVCGYGIGALGCGASYYFMSAYFVLFLTNSVGLSASIAGTISSIALMVEVVTGIASGNLSDRCNSKFGKRRPFMLASAIAMLPILVLILRTIDASTPVKVAYYLFFSILFRISFSNFEIPYNAMGAEIITDYDARTRLRTIARAVSIVGNAIGYVAPLLILDAFVDQEFAWSLIGIILAVSCSGTWLLSVFLTKEPHFEHVEQKKKNIIAGIFKSYTELFKLKPMKQLIIYKIAFSCAFALINVATLYFLQYNLGLDEKYSSYMYVFTIIIFVISTPIIDKMAIMKSKAWQQMVTFVACAVGGILVYFIAPGSIVAVAIYIGLFAFVQSGFWQLSGSLFYDIVEVDEFINHNRREGDIMSMVSVLGTFITAAMIQAFGILFDLVGFDAELAVQPESVNIFLNAAFILVPCLCLIGGAAILKVFPIDKKSFMSLQKAIELRDKGEDYSQYMDDVNRIIG